ncbi:MAG: glycosyltransferase [Acidobacteria bacterium]|nr:glycosyltransferase [Acidobacteriota bacterium]
MAAKLATRTHILTVSVEEYYHAGALRGAVRRKHWDRFESRLDRNIDDVLGLLQPHGHTATFFVLGCVAERQPELVARIAREGHEIGCCNFWPRGPAGMLPDEFREDVRRSRDALAAAGAVRLAGFRASPASLTPHDLWMLDVLASEGFEYDSSVNPVLRRCAGRPELTRIHRHETPLGRGIWELPIATVGILGWRLGIAGGNYVRQLPHWALRHIVSRESARRDTPLVFYLMPWELDTGQPQVSCVSRTNSIRLYRNLGKTRWVFADYFGRYRFQSALGYLTSAGLVSEPAGSLRHDRDDSPRPCARPAADPPAARAWPGHRDADGSGPSPAATPVSLVVPLYNEEENVGYLQRTLADFRRTLSGRYDVHVVLVDDGSSDGTWQQLTTRFGKAADCTLVRQPRNMGVAAAIMAGIARAPTSIVCSIDCDCSYDPHELAAMLPMIDGADLVTASPYHPDGRVLNVPAWRLLLSKTLSRMYSVVLGGRIHTYTSCCRVYRREAFAGMPLRHPGFLGVAEMLIEAKLRGARILEHPATLESRLFGESKMKIARTIGGHLGMIHHLLARKRGRRHAEATAPAGARR